MPITSAVAQEVVGLISMAVLVMAGVEMGFAFLLRSEKEASDV